MVVLLSFHPLVLLVIPALYGLIEGCRRPRRGNGP